MRSEMIVSSIILILLNTLSHVQAESKGPSDLEEEETVHDKLGQAHFPEVIYDDYVSKAHYSNPRTFPAMGMDSVYNFTHSLFDFFHPYNASYMLPDYVVHTNRSAFNMGNKYEENDWVDLLRENKMLILFWLLPLLFLAISMPFVGVIYCCFGCWRCKKTCPPCNKSHFRRLLCSILLFLLILGLLLAFFLALLSLKQMKRDFGYTKARVRDASKDTCTFLGDVSLHLRHLMINNFQKLSDHIDEQLNTSHIHIFLDLSDTSGGNALIELERIFKNMEPALKLFKFLDDTEKTLRFLGAIHRDSWRGVKRDITYVMLNTCAEEFCHKQLRPYLKIDTSHCMHLDDMPNTTIFVEPVEGAIDENLIEIAYKAIKRVNVMQDSIRKAIEPIIPPIMLAIKRISSNLRDEYAYLNDLIESIISDIHFRDMNSADTFEDILEKLGADSHAYSSLACFVLLLIIIALVSALCWGSCSRQSNAGSNCLIIAIILIFCVFTFITLMGLFYYVLGMVTYEAVCRRLGELGDYESKSVRPVDRIAACKPDQHVYDLLAEYKLYDVERIMSNNSGEAIDVDDVRWSDWKGDLSGFKILTLDERTLLNKTVFELYPYTGALYTKNVCKTLRSPSTEISFEWRSFIYSKVYATYRGCYEEHYEVCTNGNKIMTDARKAERQEPDILRCIDAIEETTTKIDALITGKGFTFGETISKLLDKVEKCEKFLEKRGLEYINTIGRNLTESLKMQFEKYRVYTQSRIQDSVGPCGPLIYHLDRGTKAACRQLIDPINGFWMGLLMSSLLFLPLLYVAHSLICLYRPHRVKSTFVHLNRNEGCPTCTGHPYVPPPTVICSGAQERDWDAIDIETVDSKSKID